MAVRAAMTELIEIVRDLIGDTAGSSEVMSNRQIQRVLDEHRETVRYGELTPLDTIASGGTVTYLIYQAPVGHWEADAALVDSNYDAVTPATSDEINGEWTFSSNRTAPVFITGRYYDVYAAAAALCEMWAAKIKLQIDYDTDGRADTWTQKSAQLLEMAAELRARQRPRTSFMTRSYDR